MKSFLVTLILFFHFSLCLGQECEVLCVFFENGNDISKEQIDCSCFTDLYNKYSELYSDARDKNDFFGQGLALDKLARIADLPLRDTLRASFYINYLYKYGVYNKNISNLEYSKNIFEDILESISEAGYGGRQYFEIYNMSLHQLAEIATANSKYNEAITHLQQAIDLELRRSEERERTPTLCSMQSRIGYNYSQLGNHEKAYEYYLRGNQNLKDALEKNDEPLAKTDIDYYVTHLSWEVKETLHLNLLGRANDLLKLITSIQTPGSPINTSTYQLWAEYYYKVNQIDSAKHYFKKAKNGILALPNNSDKYLSYLLKYAHFLKDEGLLDEALKTLNSAKVENAVLKSKSSKWSKDMVSVETETINLLYKIKDLKGTLKKIEELSYEIEDRLSGAVIFQDHISFIQQFYPIFEIGLEIIFQYFPEKLDLAYRLIESTKAISLYKSSKLSSVTKKQTQSDVLENYRMLSSEANQFKMLQAQGDSSLETTTRLYALRARMETLKKLLIIDHKKDLITLPKYQESLKNKMHVLSFAGKQHYYFLQVSKEHVRLFRRDAKSIESLAGRYIHEISTFQSENHKEAAAEMGIFLEAILQVSNKRKVLFTGDGALAQIPLESLVTSKGELFLMNTAITYAPSARIQYFLTLERSTLTPRTIVFRPTFNQDLLPLKFAKQESQTIVKETKADLYVDGAANKAAFFTTSENYDIIHLATHAKSVDNDPSKSYIQLSNSKMYFDEIKSLILNAELVCLSACETNTGKTYNGEGVQSLSRNFIAAGSKSVVSSLWEIPDKNTSEITISFYQYLRNGYDKAEALQRAKIDFIKKYPDEGLHPYGWAGLVLTGNENAIFKKTSKAMIAGASGILISTLLLILSLVNSLRKPQSSPV